MPSRNIEDLCIEMQEKARLFDVKCKAFGIDYLRYCTYRPDIEQDTLYKIGRTMPGKIVTNARAGESKHNYTIDEEPASKAFDGVPLIGGKPLWNMEIMDTTGRKMLHPVWERVGEVGESLGLQWGYRWKGKLKEGAHWELKS